ncbi:MAG TPA: SIS domain-containing protein [Phycisphaerae bacterium]|nr:SIS domain-containing protein [Phycisphaerae bacterium]HUX15743.1 SIS domain-containing protein [Phycisphaerae bacterium]
MAEPFVSRYLSGLREVLDEIGVDAVERVIQIIFEAYRKGRHIFIIGNGGSAATASHMMCDLAKGCAVEGKPRMKAMSLTDNVSVMTAVSNDISYEKVFTEQLKVFLEEGDVLIAITASGDSPNVLDAVRYAGEKGAVTIGFIGFGGGKLKAMVDVDVTVFSRNDGHVEDVHCILEHLISQCLRQRIRAS